jgi:hypothetical protein
MSYVYRSIYNTEESDTRHDVGFFTPDGKWYCESTHPGAGDAAARVSYLNGGNDPDALRHLTNAIRALVVALERKR